MTPNLRETDRDQLFLLPPSFVDWLPELLDAFLALDTVEELDLSAFYVEYRGDGRGGTAYDPAFMLAVLLDAYCVGERSSRPIISPDRRHGRTDPVDSRGRSGTRCRQGAPGPLSPRPPRGRRGTARCAGDRRSTSR